MKKITLQSPPHKLLSLFLPVLLFPIAYFPYRQWGIAPFANLMRKVLYGQEANALWLAFDAGETVIFFWLTISAVVVITSVVVAILKIRPWYFIPLYLVVIISLCGICAIGAYNLMSIL